MTSKAPIRSFEPLEQRSPSGGHQQSDNALSARGATKCWTRPFGCSRDPGTRTPSKDYATAQGRAVNRRVCKSTAKGVWLPESDIARNEKPFEGGESL
jgi:hypothetical protein